jgi:glycine amidinotransferase
MESNGATPSKPDPVVNSHNEWDPLEEVIVGRLEGATVPYSHAVITAGIPKTVARIHPFFGGRHFPKILTSAAQRELDELIHILQAEGVTVRRPDPIDQKRMYRTPSWKSSGYCITCPRDGFLVVGDEIIETPMAWRSRYFEAFAYRSLFKEYFAAGARWTAAPRPELPDELYDQDFVPPEPGEPKHYIINEYEPVFDAADFVRCGRDIFGIRSSVTNATGFAWLRRHLGDEYRVHELESKARQPMHIDSSFLPLAPGKVLVNPVNIDIDRLPPMLKSWDILVAPQPDPLPRGSWRFTVSFCSPWISVNVLSLDERRVVVEKNQVSLQKALRDWGFEPIPCPFLSYAVFGGAFHCATLDVRRRGELLSYF